MAKVSLDVRGHVCVSVAECVRVCVCGLRNSSWQ